MGTHVRNVIGWLGVIVVAVVFVFSTTAGAGASGGSGGARVFRGPGRGRRNCGSPLRGVASVGLEGGVSGARGFGGLDLGRGAEKTVPSPPGSG